MQKCMALSMDSGFIEKNVEGPGIILGRLTSLGKKLFNTFSKGERGRKMT